LLLAAAWLGFELAMPVAAIAHGDAAAVAGAAQLALMTATYVVLARHFAAPLRGALLWPVGLVLGVAMLVRSGVLAWWREAIVWRATVYGRGEIEAGRRWVAGRVRLG
jgi:hypothetical protein